MTSYSNDQNLPNGPNGASPVWSAWAYSQKTASGQVKASPGYIAGLIAEASSSGVVTIYDSLAGSGTALYTGTLTAGQIVTFPSPFYCTTGIYLLLVSGTATVNVVYR